MPFGRYRLIHLLSRGGMGEVWRAFDPMTDRVVALKVLPAQFAHDARYQHRFRREARSAAGLSEPHVVPIHDFGEIDGRLYVTMRFIEGRDLHTMLRTGPLEPTRAIYIVEQVASALHAAHRINLVHRDVKPSNILVAEDDFAYLIDFGIAQAIGDTSLTITNGVAGTWAYLAPERLSGEKSDHRADIYALTCVMHECLTGSQPFPGDSIEQQLGGHLTLPPPRPSAFRATLPTELDNVVAKGMAKDPAERYASTRELATAARAAINRPPPASEPVWPTQPAPLPQPTPPAQPTLPAHQFQPNYPPVGQFPPAPVYPPALPPYHAPLAAPPRPTNTARRVAWASAAAAVVIIGIVLAVVLANSGGGSHSGHTASNAAAGKTSPANTGPFTGLYRAAFGPSTTNGKPDRGATAQNGQWSVRSQCQADVCVATATATGGLTLQSSFVFDKVGDQWRAVSLAPVASAPTDASDLSRCTFPGDYWSSLTLQPQPDGTLTGEYRAAPAAGHCETARTVAFTRIGDADLDVLPDPSNQGARVVSPAAGLRGHYHGTRTPDDGRKPVSWDSTIQTDCLRAGDRCVTYENTDTGFDVLLFADGRWTDTYEGTNSCSVGGTEQVKYTYEFSLPPAPQDPIPHLTGHGHRDISGTQCAGAFNEALKYDRIGD